jgi:N-dimethylarginine dimethylaminohydrolase
MPDTISDHTMSALLAAGVQVVTVPYDKMFMGGGGLHCSTAPLLRDEV